MPYEHRERERADHGVGDDLGRAEPVEALAALEHGLQRADADREQPQADPVHPADALRVARVAQVGQGQQQRDDAEGDVDVEDPRPREHVGDVAAEGGPERGADHDADAEDRHRGAVLAGREHFVEHRLRGREQRAAAQALDDAPGHQLGERVGVAAEERGDGEQRDRAGEVAAAPEERGQPAGDRQHDDVGDDVAGRDPGDLVERGAQVPHHVGDRHVDDAGVDQLHDRGQRYRDRDDVAVRVRIGRGGQACGGTQGGGGHGDEPGARRCG